MISLSRPGCACVCVCAMDQGNGKKLSDFNKRVQAGRARFEKPRNEKSKILQGDLAKIFKDEVAFSKAFLQQIVPIQVSIDKDAKGLKKLVPVTLKIVDFDEDNTPIDNGNDNDNGSENDAYLVDQI